MVNKITVNNQDSNYTHSIFDISEYTGISYDTLSDALNAIPQAKCKGGMTIRYIDSNNKYIQARCMTQNFTTDVTQWQGVDDEPTVGSKNLVESGGVFRNENFINTTTLTSFNRNNGYFYNLLTRTAVQNPSYFWSEVSILTCNFIEMRFPKSTGGGLGVEFRDSNKAKIESYSNTTENNGTKLSIPVPSGAAYIVFSYLTNTYATNKGIPVFDGVNFYQNVSVKEIVTKNVQRIENIENTTRNTSFQNVVDDSADFAITDGNANAALILKNGRILTKTFDSENIGRNVFFSKDTGNQLQDNVTLTELYTIYDNLVTKYPQFIKRGTDIGLASDGQAIRQYEIRFNTPRVITGEGSYYTKPNEWTDAVYAKNIVLINAGTHGDEKAPCIGTALAIKSIVEGMGIFFDSIRSNLIIKVVPTLNPYGFQNRTRKNYNDQDINRDISAQTQAESQAWKSWVDANTDVLYYFDMHGVDYYHPFFECAANTSQDHKIIYANEAANLASMFYYNWKNYLNDGKEDLAPRPYLIISQYQGMTISYTESIGIKGYIIETPCDIVDNAKNPAPNSFLSKSKSNKLTIDMLTNLLYQIANKNIII